MSRTLYYVHQIFCQCTGNHVPSVTYTTAEKPKSRTFGHVQPGVEGISNGINMNRQRVARTRERGEGDVEMAEEQPRSNPRDICESG